MTRTLTVAALSMLAITGAAAQAKPPAPAPAPKPAAAPAAAPATPIAAGVMGDVEQWKGVVMAINQKSRHVVLKGPQGTLHSFVVNPAIPNLDKVQKGDTVTVTYVESVALYVREANEPAEAAGAEKVTVQPKGLPALTDIAVKEVQVKVTAIDQPKRTLTVVGPSGNPYTVNVDPAVKAFSKIKVGDDIDVRYSEAVAVTVAK